MRKLLCQRAHHEGAQAFAAPGRGGVVIGTDLPVMRVDVIDHEGCIAGEAEQQINRQFGKPIAAMREFMRDRGPGKCKEIAGEPQRADRFERLLGQAWAQGGETDQEKRQKADQRKRQIEIHRAKDAPDAPALFERCIIIAAHLVGERSKDQRQGENDPRRPPADEQGRCPEHEQDVRGPIAQRRKQAAGLNQDGFR